MHEASSLPTREALTARLEAQRGELLRAMSCVNLAKRIIEEHTLTPPVGAVLSHKPNPSELYQQRVLDALSDAGDALAAAYPILERIAQGLAVAAILAERTPEESGATGERLEEPTAAGRSAASR